ncbi:MAG: hypothetical protein Q9203_005207 [Teloschistes exilis]
MIDALDECDPKRRHELLKALRIIVQNSSNLVKIIISSRDDADIICRLNSVPNVYIRSSDNGDDVDRFIEHEFEKAIDEQRLLKGRVPENLRKQILLALKTRANGMFLWARLQIQNLCDPERMLITRDVEDALLRPPPTLFQLYNYIMEHINRNAPHGQRLAKKTLRWLLYAREPLTEDILTQLLGFTTSQCKPLEDQYAESLNIPDQYQDSFLEDEILSICCNLVILDRGVFHFAHASVQEYLETQPGFGLQEINLEAAQDCLSFLLSCWRDSPPWSDEKLGSLAEYAVKFWLKHYSKVDFHWRSHQQIASTVRPFFIQRMIPSTGSHATDYDIWAQSFFRRRGQGSSSRVDPSQLVTDGVLDNNLTFFLDEGVSLLAIACMYGLREIVGEMWSGDIDLAKSLHHASYNGHQEIVEKLIELGANPNTEVFFETALHAAIRRGHDGTVLLMLQYGANPNIQNYYSQTALDIAIKEEHLEVIKVLIKHGAEDEASRKYGEPLVFSVKIARPSERSSDFFHLIRRATGCVEIDRGGFINVQITMLYLLYTIRPSYYLLRNIMSEDHVDSSTSINMGCLLTMMETDSQDQFMSWNGDILTYFGDLLKDTSPFARY